MRLNIKLPPAYEKKWQRISAFLGSEVDVLIVQGIDYVWERYGGDVVGAEKMAMRCKRNLENAELKLMKSQMNGTVSLVGSFKRKVDESGCFRLPKCWFRALSAPSSIWLLRDKERICLLSEEELVKCDRNTKRLASELSVDTKGKVKFDTESNLSCFGKFVTLSGCIRYITIQPSS